VSQATAAGAQYRFSASSSATKLPATVGRATASRIRQRRNVRALLQSADLDELAIGFTLGLVHLPVIPVIIAIAVQALAASQLGLSLGSRIGEKRRERAERVAGSMLAVLGLVLIGQQLPS
jgi:putative Mn2+ efflux pump MntP